MAMSSSRVGAGGAMGSVFGRESRMVAGVAAKRRRRESRVGGPVSDVVIS